MLIKTNEVIHCKTKEEARLFARLSGAVWNGNNGTLLDNDRWEMYVENTCYRRNTNGRYTIGDLSGYEREGSYKIIEFSDLLNGAIWG